MSLAIDLGTSNTKAALVIEEKLILVRDSFQPESSFFPSSVYLTPEGQILVGHAADAMRDTDVRRYRKEFKRDFGEDVPYQLGDRQLLPQDLVSAVLSKVKQEAEIIAQSYGENSLTKVVLTVPASYNGYKKRLMQKVAEGVGFTEVQLLPEPEAAAYYYNRNNIISNGDIVLVYDLGGGTFDAALLRKEGEGYKSLVPPTGIDGCGGIDFDRQIYRRIRGQIKDSLLVERLGTFNDVKAQQDREILGDFCRRLKHQLSQVPNTFGRLMLDREMYELTQEDFNLMIESVIDETVTECLGLVKDANLKVDELNHVLLIGGSCRIPYVRKLLEARLTEPLFHLREPDLAVCQGAVLFASETTVNRVVKTTKDGKSKSNRARASTTNKTKANVKTKIIGFNFCHGETSLHWTWDSGTDSSGKLPESLKVTGQPESFVTAIAYDDKQEKVIAIGEAAFIYSKNGDIDNIDICAKTRLNKATQKVIKDYVKYIYDDLVRTKCINPNQDYQILFYVGHPSGWDEETVDLYQEILAEVLPNVKVTPKSRAGLMSVIKTNQVSLEELGKSVLVIDIGSSTTDFTLVGNQVNKPFEEAGVDLGGALIDEAIYEKSLEKLQQELEAAKKEAKQRLENIEEQDDYEDYYREKELRINLGEFIKDSRALDEAVRKVFSQDISGTENKQKKALEDMKKELKQKINNIEEIEKRFSPQSNHPLKSIAKFKCRQLKERYFSGGYLGGLGFALKGGFTFEPIKDKNQLKNIINQKLKQLGHKTWAEAFRQQLESVKNKLNSQNIEPGALFLTGDASRMGFIQDICEELFPNTKFVRDTKPEICISRCLALWGQTDYKLAVFLEEVEKFLEKDLSEVIGRSFSFVFDDLSEVLSDQILQQVVEQSIFNFSSLHQTVEDVHKKINQDAQKFLDSQKVTIWASMTKNKNRLKDRVLREIEEEINNISDKYKLSIGRLIIYDVLDLTGINFKKFSIPLEEMVILIPMMLSMLPVFAEVLEKVMKTMSGEDRKKLETKEGFSKFKEENRRDFNNSLKALGSTIVEDFPEAKSKIKKEIKKYLGIEPEVVSQIVKETKESVRELVRHQADKLKLLIL